MKLALITGAGRGIGHAIAEHLLAKDYGVLLHANSSESLLKDWVKHHPRASQVQKILSADLSLADEQDRFIEDVRRHFTRLDVIVHNASDFFPCPFSQVTRETYKRLLGINLDAPYFITQGLLPLLTNSNDPSVINIVDAMWERPRINFSPYSIAKAGLVTLTRALAKELAPHIRVNGIAPGAMSFNAYANSDIEKQNIIKGIPFNRLGCGHDIALAVEFLAENAPYMTGEIINIDGGRSIS